MEKKRQLGHSVEVNPDYVACMFMADRHALGLSKLSVPSVTYIGPCEIIQRASRCCLAVRPPGSCAGSPCLRMLVLFSLILQICLRATP